MGDFGRAPSGQALAVPAEPVSSVSALTGFDPSRLSLDDTYRLRNAGSNFGSPAFSRLACEWMGVQGFAKPRREKGRWTLTPLGREAQGWVLSRAERPHG